MNLSFNQKKALNPYLPSWEYVPDGEPHVFGDRVYVYGSHDFFNGWVFCLGDYVCWSAPEDDLSDWRYEGVIFKKTQDPRNPDGSHALWAPDVWHNSNPNVSWAETLEHAEKIGIGSREYELVKMK